MPRRDRHRNHFGQPGLADVNVAMRRARSRNGAYVCLRLRCEECEEVVERTLARAPWLASAPFAGEPARRLAGDAHTLHLLPHEHGTDGYFMASFKVLEEAHVF